MQTYNSIQSYFWLRLEWNSLYEIIISDFVSILQNNNKTTICNVF